MTDGSEMYRETLSDPCVRPPRRALVADTIVMKERSGYPCRLVFRETGIVLRGDSTRGVPDPGRRLARDSRGRLFTSIEGNSSQIAVWNPDGTYDTTIARQGQGPGELPPGREPTPYVDVADRVHVRSTQGVWLVFGPDLKPISRGAVPGLMASGNAVLGDGTVLSVRPNQPQFFSIGDPVTGATRSFGDVPQPIRDLNMAIIQRWIASRGDTLFWAGPVPAAGQGYVLELWSTSGTHLKTFRRDVPWYPDVAVPDYGQSATVEPTTGDMKDPGPPVPTIRPMNIDGAGLPLIFASVANDRWRWIPDREERARESAGFENLHIEVLDPDAGVVLASEIVNDALRRREIIPNNFIPGTRLGFRRVEDGDGVGSLHIVEYQLVRR
jgi:hypothetical protein